MSIWSKQDRANDLKMRSEPRVCRDGIFRNAVRQLTPEERHARFLKFIQKDKITGCWNWLGAVGGSTSKYPHLCVNGKLVKGHRYSWEFYNNSTIPIGKIVRHKCDNKLCVNPKHLLVGTQRDNILDMDKRGRRKIGFLYGELSPCSKYTQAMVLSVLRLRKIGRTIPEIASETKVGRSAVSSILCGRSWNQITGLPRKR